MLNILPIVLQDFHMLSNILGLDSAIPDVGSPEQTGFIQGCQAYSNIG